MGLGKRSETSLELGRGGARDAVRLRTPAASGASSPSDERDRERGSILLLFALFITLFALLCAVVVDVGYWWVIGKKAQVAADACALAAAQSIPTTNPTGIECVIDTGGRDYVLENLPVQDGTEPMHTGTEVEWPYVNAQGASNPSEVEATVHLTVGTFFGRVVGLEHISLTRRAVAEQTQGAGNYAIYSHSADCPGSLQFNGNNHIVDGRVHSNGEYLVNNGGPEPFWAQAGTAVKCVSLQPPGQIRFGGDGWETGATAPDMIAAQNWPEYFNPAEFGWPTCSGASFVGQKVEISETEIKVTGQPPRPLPLVGGRRVIPSGTYCATELFQISGNHMDGHITALAPKIEVQGNDLRFTPFAANDVLFFQIPNIDSNPSNDGEPDGTGPITCINPTVELLLSNGNDGQWEGKVFNPCGQVRINGNDTASFDGAIYGLRVRINGNGFTMTGTGGSAAAKTIALVE